MMAMMTMELRSLLKTNFVLFDFEYQFDDLKKKAEIEQAILDYYYFYEIGQETPDRFKHTFKRLFLNCISYYNQLHNTTLLSYDPLTNYKLTEAYNELQEGLTTSATKGTLTNKDISKDTINSNSKTTTVQDQTTTENGGSDSVVNGNVDEKSSDYPQGSYINDSTHLSEAKNQKTDNSTTTSSQNTNVIDFDSTDTTVGDSLQDTVKDTNQNTTGDSTVDISSNRDYEKVIEGITGHTYQELISAERSNLIRINDMIISELKPAFALIYS